MPQNPNHQPAAPAELSPEERAIFTIAKVDEWRHRQISILAGLRANARDSQDTQYADDFYSTIDSTLEDFLHEQGIDQSSPNYSEVRQLFYDARVGNDQDGGISNHVWENSPKARGVDQNDEKSQRAVFAERIADRLDVDSDDIQDIDIDVLHAEALVENARFDVGNAREAWALASAKRQGRMRSMKDTERDGVRDDYHQKVQKLGIMELEGQISDDDDDTAKNAKVIAWLFNEQDRLRELTTEKLKSTRTSKFVEWMNKGNKLQKIGKSALVGLAASGAAAGISLVAGFGLVAGAAGGAAAGAVGFGRFVRGFAKGDRQRGMKTAQESFIDDDRQVELEDTENDPLVERFKVAAGLYNEGFEEDTKLEQKKRRKAVYRGLTNVALGVGVGAAVHYVSDFFDGSDVEAPKDKPGAGSSDMDHDGIPDAEDTDRDGDGVIDAKDSDPNDPDVWLPDEDGGVVFDPSEVAHDARWVERGEGWYQTFDELGIPQHDWAQTLELAGPKLHEQGWSYFDESANEWRISQPGRLSDEALSTIAGSAKQAGYDLAA